MRGREPRGFAMSGVEAGAQCAVTVAKQILTAKQGRWGSDTRSPGDDRSDCRRNKPDTFLKDMEQTENYLFLDSLTDSQCLSDICEACVHHDGVSVTVDDLRGEMGLDEM